MSGIVNSTGASSGIIGTTVGTASAAGAVLQVVTASDDTQRTASDNNAPEEGELAVSASITTLGANSYIYIIGTSSIYASAGHGNLTINLSDNEFLYTTGLCDRVSDGGFFGNRNSMGSNTYGDNVETITFMWYPGTIAAGTTHTLQVRAHAYRQDTTLVNRNDDPEDLNAGSTIMLIEYANANVGYTHGITYP